MKTFFKVSVLSGVIIWMGLMRSVVVGILTHGGGAALSSSTYLGPLAWANLCIGLAHGAIIGLIYSIARRDIRIIKIILLATFVVALDNLYLFHPAFWRPEAWRFDVLTQQLFPQWLVLIVSCAAADWMNS